MWTKIGKPFRQMYTIVCGYLFELHISFCLYFSYLMVQKGFCVPYNNGCKYLHFKRVKGYTGEDMS